MRLFTALDPPASSRERLAIWQAWLQERLNCRRWPKLDSSHLTLHFLGEVAPERLGALEAALREGATGHGAFTLRLSGLGAFPSTKRPRVVWAGVGGDLGALSALHASLRERLVAGGFTLDDRPYRPHVTLGREVETGARFEARPEVGPDWEVWAFSLYRSHLGPQGPRYEELARFELGKERGAPEEGRLTPEAGARPS